MKTITRPWFILLLLISLFIFLKLPLAITNDYYMNDQVRMGGVSIAIRDFGISQGLMLTVEHHGSLLLESIIFLPFVFLNNWLFLYKLVPLFIQLWIVVISFLFFKNEENVHFGAIFSLFIILGPRLLKRTILMYGSQQEGLLFSIILVYLLFSYLKFPSSLKLFFLFFLSGFNYFLEPSLLILSSIVLIYIIYKKKLFKKPLQSLLYSLYFLIGLTPVFYLKHILSDQPSINFFFSSLSYLIFLIRNPGELLVQLQTVFQKIPYLFDYGHGNIWIILAFTLLVGTFFYLGVFYMKSKKQGREESLLGFLLFYSIIFTLSYTVASKFDVFGVLSDPFSHRNLIYLYLPFFYFITKIFFLIIKKKGVLMKTMGVSILCLFLFLGVHLNFQNLGGYSGLDNSYYEVARDFTAKINDLGINTIYADPHTKWSGYFLSNGKTLFACGYDLFSKCPLNGISPIFEQTAANQEKYGFLFRFSSQLIREEMDYGERKFLEILDNNSIFSTNIKYSKGDHNFHFYYNFSEDIRKLGVLSTQDPVLTSLVTTK